MIPSRHTDFSLESATDSVMTRSVEGVIKFWNHAAKDLYGWKKEEAIGRVSHDLLKTQFPKPLEEIDSELVTKGRWEGKLIHATRNGSRVVVESRWVLDRSGGREEVIEFNAPSTEEHRTLPERATISHKGEERSPGPSPARKLIRAGAFNSKLSTVLIGGGVVLVLLALVVYGIVGHDFIKAIYEGRSFGFDGWVMEGKAVTPLEDYYAAADASIVKWLAYGLLFAPLALLCLKRPAGAFMAGFSVFTCLFLLFCLLELMPSLITALRTEGLSSYYAYRTYYMPDEVLGWRGRPHAQLKRSDFGDEANYQADSIGAPLQRLEWKNDENGFRNSTPANSYDVVITGDSFMAFGDSQADTFPSRLEKRLQGLTVLNLGIGGYGPFQYLEALKTYGLPKRPKYALFVFYSGNDINDIGSYVQWKNGEGKGIYSLNNLSFLERFGAVVSDLASNVNRLVRAFTSMLLERAGVIGGYPYTEPKVAVIDLQKNRRYHVSFVDLVKTEPPEEIKRSHEWSHLRTILSRFKDACESNGVKAIAVYIPSATEIYAAYSTDESGTEWRSIRDRQIAARKNLESAFVDLSQELNIELINLSTLFGNAAAKGEMLYYSFDSHWNPYGRELAARYVAGQMTRQMRLIESAQLPPKMTTPARAMPAAAH